MEATDDTKLNILHDHYKDTFNQIRNYIVSRDRLLILILLVSAIMLFQIFSPKESGLMIAQFVSKKIGLDSPFDPSFLGSIIWFSMLGLIIKYFQVVGLIEKQFDYIHLIEENIAKSYGNNHKLFTREGLHYLDDYPLFSDWTSFLYTKVFPIILSITIILKIYHEIIAGNYSVIFFVNLIIFICIFTSIILYLRMLHFKKNPLKNFVAAEKSENIFKKFTLWFSSKNVRASLKKHRQLENK